MTQTISRTLFANDKEIKLLRKAAKPLAIKIKKVPYCKHQEFYRKSCFCYGLRSMYRELNLETDVCYRITAFDTLTLKQLIHVWRTTICVNNQS